MKCSIRSACSLLVFATATLSLGGCMNEKLGTQTLIPPSEAELGAACAKLGTLGNVTALTQGLNADVNQMLTLADRPSEEASQQVTALADDLTQKVQALKASTAPEFTVEKWATQMNWSFGPGDLALLGSSCDVTEKRFTSAQVEKVVVDGMERADLLNQASFTLASQAVTFSLHLTQTSLSLCELQNITGLEVRVTFQACGQSDWRDYRLSLRNFSVENLP